MTLSSLYYIDVYADTIEMRQTQGAYSPNYLKTIFEDFFRQITFFRKLVFTKYSQVELSCIFLKENL